MLQRVHCLRRHLFWSGQILVVTMLSSGDLHDVGMARVAKPELPQN
jgi:hypothetical protein